jgi:hypothetical protein
MIFLGNYCFEDTSSEFFEEQIALFPLDEHKLWTQSQIFMKFCGVVAYVDDIQELKFQLKIRKGVGSVGVQSSG